MKLTEQEKDIVRRKFGKYCIKVLNGEALNYLGELEKMREKEVMFSELLWNEEQPFYFDEDSFLTNHFRVMDMDIEVKDDCISDALLRLPEKKRLILLMIYFLDMTEQEIAECLDLVQSTVHYHKVDSLKLLKNMLE